MNKVLLKMSIAVTGIALGLVHYKIKPGPDEKALRESSQELSSSTHWQGQIAPDFELTTTRGDHFQLSESMGKKIVVLNFFATWCGPCRDEMPELNRYFNEHKAESFQLVAIDAEEKPDVVEQFFQELKLDFPVGIDSGPIRKQYGVHSFPTTVLIGVDGKVQFYEIGGLANTEVAFDAFLRINSDLMKTGRIISPEDYRRESQKQLALPSSQAEDRKAESRDDGNRLDARGQRIVARMDCPCGCEKKVQTCTCNTSKKIKKALSSENFQERQDGEVIRSLNKRFCGEGM